MGHKNVVPAKFFKSADGLLGRRGVGNHGIVDAGQVNDLLRDRLAGVDEGAELLFLVDLAVFNIDRADFGQALGVESRPVVSVSKTTNEPESGISALP